MSHAVGLIVVAAGQSTRMAGTDKVWADLDDRPVVWHALRNLAPTADAIVLVVRGDNQARAESALLPDFPGLSIVTGGAQRYHSVQRGLAALPDVAVIAVHDAARPLARAEVVVTGARLVEECDAAVPVLPVTDTVKEVNGEGIVLKTVERAALRSAQTPQIFRGEVLRLAHEMAHLHRGSITDDAALLEDQGFRVRTFPGDARAFKITTEYDLRLARLLVSAGPQS